MFGWRFETRSSAIRWIDFAIVILFIPRRFGRRHLTSFRKLFLGFFHACRTYPYRLRGRIGTFSASSTMMEGGGAAGFSSAMVSPLDLRIRPKVHLPTRV